MRCRVGVHDMQVAPHRRGDARRGATRNRLHGVNRGREFAHPASFEPGLRYAGLVSTVSLFSTVIEAAGAAPAPESPPAFPPLPRTRTEPPLRFAVSEYGLPVFELYLLVSETPGVDIASFALRQKAIQDASWKLITAGDRPATLFDLTADPGEERPLDPKSAEAGTVLAALLDLTYGDLPVAPSTGSWPVLDEQTREALKALGYLR